MTCDQILKKLSSQADPESVAALARFGIKARKAYGVSIPVLRRIARKAGRDRLLAEQLWATAIHEARILSSMIDDPLQVTEAQMERWVGDFDSWDICDACCSNLFDKTVFAYQKAIDWSKRDSELVKRAGFVLMATLAVHDKRAKDASFVPFLRIVHREATDVRNFVKKGVNWALRQIGKRNSRLNKMAIKEAKKIQGIDSRSAKWIASDALRELTSAAVQARLRKGTA
jgi:3-methyladenine DNA glycosylase AlkD